MLLVAGGVYPGFWRGPWSGLPGCAPEQIIVAAKSLFTCCASPLRIHQHRSDLRFERSPAKQAINSAST